MPTKRRDDDPVKVTGQPGAWLIQYYASGVVGIGNRIKERNRAETRLEADQRAEEIRSTLRAGAGRVPRQDDLFGEVCREYVQVVGPTLKAGTLKAYRRDLNAYILPVLRAVPVRELGVAHFALVVDRIVGR